MPGDTSGLSLLHAWRDRFAANDTQGLKALWARDYPRLSYHPTERITPMLSWTEIEAYYDNLSRTLSKTEWRIWNEFVDPISEEAAFARTDLEMVYEATFAGHPTGRYRWTGRAAFSLVKQDGAWKIIHYEDSTYLFELLPLVKKFQAPLMDRVAEHIGRSDFTAAMAALEALRQDVAYTQLFVVD